MRKVTIGAKKMELRASPLAPLFYKQAFDRDIMADIARLEPLAKGLKEGSLEGFDSVLILQFAYAMARAGDRKLVLNFEDWLESLEYIDYTDLDWMVDVIEEAADGFFRPRGAAPEAAGTKPKPKSKGKGKS